MTTSCRTSSFLFIFTEVRSVFHYKCTIKTGPRSFVAQPLRSFVTQRLYRVQPGSGLCRIIAEKDPRNKTYREGQQDGGFRHQGRPRKEVGDEPGGSDTQDDPD